MAVIPIDNLTAGMILKRAVCDRSGRLLLPEGAELNQKHLMIFRTWGVCEADIDCDDDPETSLASPFVGISPEILAEAEEKVRQLFSHNNHSVPVIAELMKICIARKIEHAC